MANAETNLQAQIMMALSDAGHTPFRNNTGAFKDKSGRLVRYGVGGKGGPDLWVICKDGIACGIEVKTATGRLSKEQENFLSWIRSKGGRSGVARSVADALAIALDTPRLTC